MTALRGAWIAQLADKTGYSRAMVEPAVAHFREHRNRVTLFEAAAPLLKRLRQTYTVGAITNGNAQLDRIGIDHLFNFTVCSADAGMAKPQAGIFHRALGLARAAPRAAVHVGDDPANDVLGAGRVGMRTIWYNPALKPWPGGRQPDAVIRSLQEIESVLARWTRSDGGKKPAQVEAEPNAHG
jgi:putative hydrolase of the HAD superfamily